MEALRARTASRAAAEPAAPAPPAAAASTPAAEGREAIIHTLEAAAPNQAPAASPSTAQQQDVPMQVRVSDVNKSLRQ